MPRILPFIWYSFTFNSSLGDVEGGNNPFRLGDLGKTTYFGWLIKIKHTKMVDIVICIYYICISYKNGLLMKWIGIITGDIVGSTKILKTGWRDKLLEVMHKTVEDLDRKSQWEGVKLEINRGDEFQIKVGNPAMTLSTAILMRAMLITTSDRITRWDARMGIGIGECEYLADSLSESDGEVFNMSGLVFDGLAKNSRLDIVTPHTDFNAELAVGIAFADDIISNWTPRQAEIYTVTFEKNRTQKEIAVLLGTSPQTISKLAIAGKTELVTNFLNRFESKIVSITNAKTPSHDLH